MCKPPAAQAAATPWQDELLHEALHELEAVAERHFTDARDLRDRLLRAALPARQGREVDRGRGGPRGGQGHRAVDLLEFFENLLGLCLDRVRQAEPRAEPAHVVRRPGGRDAKRDRVAPRVLVRERNHGRESGRASDVAARSPRAREAVIFFDRIGRPFGTFIDRSLADHEAARIADKLAARVVAHEVLAPAFRADPVLFHDRFRRRTARHDQPSGGLLLSGLNSVNITRLYYTLSSLVVTTLGATSTEGVVGPR